MKVYVILAVCSLALSSLAEIRYNRPRGPPLPPRPPFGPQFKGPKYPPHGRIPNRNYVRPIPVQMASYKQPVYAPRPPRVPAPVIFPSAIWKTPANVYRPPIDKPFLQNTINKPYEYVNDSPALNGPAITNTIKQIGEKGPIHTIPAPNLSPADKPAVIREEFPHKAAYNFKEHEFSTNSLQNLPLSNAPQALPLVQQIPQQGVSFHQYQVNEYQEQQVPSERPAQFVTQQQTYFAPDPDPKLTLNNFNADLSSLATNTNLFPQGSTLGTPQPAILAAQHNIVSPPGLLSYQELQQILNSIPQQHLVDSYGTPLVQQPQLQQHFMQQANLPIQQNQLFQPEFLNQIQDVPDSIKNNFKPQFHTFNYEEQSRHSPVPNDFAQSRVTGDYQIEPETSENNPSVSIQSPNEALAQTQYVQQYFANSEDNVNDNVVEDESDKEATRILSQLASNGDVSPNMFYTSLPNREAAEALASLQAAGNVNSNLMKNLPQNDQPSNGMRIYVPDEEESEEMQTSGETEESKEEPKQGIRVFETTYLQQNPENHKSKDSVEYDDLSQSDESRTGKEEYNTKNYSFGSRIKAKNET